MSDEFFNARDEIMDWIQSKNQAKEIQSEMIVKLKQQPHNSSNDNNIEKKKKWKQQKKKHVRLWPTKKASIILPTELRPFMRTSQR